MARLVLVLGTLLLLISTAHGAEPAWQPVGLSGKGAMFNPAISPADPKVAIVHCDMSAAYLTDDGGATWHMIPTILLRSNTRCRAAFHPTDPKIIYSPSDWSDLKISHDGGVHWDLLANFGDDGLTGPITIDPREPLHIIVGAGKGVRFSGDGGKTWEVCKGIKGALVGAYFARAGDAAQTIVATDQGVWRRDAAGAVWKDVSAGLPSGNLRGFSAGAKDGRTIVYCTIPGEIKDGQYSGGIWRSVDLGQSWQSANGTGLNLDIKAHDEWAAAPVAQYYDIQTTDQQPQTVWATNQNTGVPPPHHASVYRSDDAGKTWRATFYPDPRYKGFNVEKDYMVAEDGQFYQDIPQITVDPHNAEHVLQIQGGECYFTTDGGKAWHCGHTRAVGTPQPGSAWLCTGLVVTTTWHYYIDPHEPNRHYICYTDIGFARSLDAGKSWLWWSQKNSSPWRNTCYELAFDRDQSGWMWGAFSDVHDIPNANTIMNRHNTNGPGGICMSTDFGATWKPCGGGLPVAPATSIVRGTRYWKDRRPDLFAGFFGKGVYRSTDDGRTWTAKNNGLGDPSNMRVCRVETDDQENVFALVTGLVKGKTFLAPGVGLYRSADHGDSWDCISKSLPGGVLWPKDFTVDPNDSKIIYLGMCDANGQKVGGLYRTTDGGTSWQRLLREGPEHFGAYLPPHHPGWIYATLTEDAPTYGLYLSKDNGKSFHPLTGLPFDNAMRVTFDPADDNMIYVSTFGGSVWRGPAD